MATHSFSTSNSVTFSVSLTIRWTISHILQHSSLPLFLPLGHFTPLQIGIVSTRRKKVRDAQCLFRAALREYRDRWITCVPLITGGGRGQDNCRKREREKKSKSSVINGATIVRVENICFSLIICFNISTAY